MQRVCSFSLGLKRRKTPRCSDSAVRIAATAHQWQVPASGQISRPMPIKMIPSTKGTTP